METDNINEFEGGTDLRFTRGKQDATCDTKWDLDSILQRDTGGAIVMMF